MKILQLVTRRQFRGAEVFAANLSKQLMLKGNEIVFAGLYKPGDQPLAVEGADNVDLNGTPSMLSFPATLLQLIRLIRKENPDIIQANGSDTLKYAIFARYFTRNIPVIYRNISMISTWVGNSKVKKTFYRWLFQQVDHVSSVGATSRDDLVNLFGYPVENTSVIRREHAHSSIFKQFGIDPHHKLVVHAGNFSPEKNQRFLLEVFRIIRKTDNTIKLMLIGDGVLFREVQEQIAKESLLDTIFLSGFRHDIAVCLAAADLFVLPSLVEGVPGVILEAASQHVPSIAPDVGGVHEVVIHGETGLIIPVHDADLFAEAIMKVLGDQEQLKRMGTNAFHLVTTNFDESRNTSIFIDIYRSLSSTNEKDQSPSHH
jgi:L-malate glycosyltransferase